MNTFWHHTSHFCYCFHGKICSKRTVYIAKTFLVGSKDNINIKRKIKYNLNMVLLMILSKCFSKIEWS